MCIAVYKPAFENFPSRTTLENCFDSNPDGAGYMFTADGSVHIKKGFMTFESFMDSLESDRSLHGDNLPYVLHFRISTQAGVRADCCHPFPLSGDMEELRELETTSRWGVAHNGIISLTSRSDKKLTYSDTMEFITNYLNLIVTKRDWWKDNRKTLLIERLINGSRLAILDWKGHCELIGSWIEDNGIYYSNSSYKYEPFYNSFNDYDLIPEDWEFFYEDDFKAYDFDESYCPYSIEGVIDYCDHCLNLENCEFMNLRIDEDIV